MITPSRMRLLGPLLLVSATACTGARNPFRDSGPPPVPSYAPAPRNTTGVVLGGRDLAEHGGTLLSFLYSRISGMAVDYSAQPCPSIQLRGRKSLMGSNNPVVYVDGTRTANSCILEMLHTHDLSRVEVYPMGVSNRPGYEAHPNGLILVFVLDGSRPDPSDRRSSFGD